MRFLHIKNEQVCAGCGTVMVMGEEAVVLRIRSRFGTFPSFFHVDRCFLEWSLDSYARRLLNWRLEATPRKPQVRKGKATLGRPPKYINPTLARRIRGRMAYYRRTGNVPMVDECKVKLEELLPKAPQGQCQTGT